MRARVCVHLDQVSLVLQAGAEVPTWYQSLWEFPMSVDVQNRSICAGHLVQLEVAPTVLDAYATSRWTQLRRGPWPVAYLPDLVLMGGFLQAHLREGEGSRDLHLVFMVGMA